MYFTRVGNSDGTAPAKNLWQVHCVLDNQDITAQMDAATSGGTGVPTLEFGADGQIVTTGFNPVTGISNTQTLTTTTGDPLTFVPATGSLVVTNLAIYTGDEGNCKSGGSSDVSR